jgi:hypothetical protein
MKRDRLVWTILFVVGAAALFGRAVFSEPGMGREYVRATTTDAGNAQLVGATYGNYVRAEQAQPGQTEYRLSAPRTVGLWLAAFSHSPFSLSAGGQSVLQDCRVRARRGVGSVRIVVGFGTCWSRTFSGDCVAAVQTWAMPGLAGEPSGISFTPFR